MLRGYETRFKSRLLWGNKINTGINLMHEKNTSTSTKYSSEINLISGMCEIEHQIRSLFFSYVWLNLQHEYEN